MEETISTHTDNSLFKSHGDRSERESLYVLKRDSGSFQSRGYLFLAVAFGMMAYQSYTGQKDTSLASAPIPTVEMPSKPKFAPMMKPLTADEDVDEMDDKMQNMNLLSSDVSDAYLPDSQLLDDQQINSQQNLNKESDTIKQSQFATGKIAPEQIVLQGNMGQMVKSLIDGKYQYLTYLMSSTACLYFWLAPNHQKMQLIKPVARVVHSKSHSKKQHKKKKSNGSQYIIYNDKLMKVDEVAVEEENS